MTGKKVVTDCPGAFLAGDHPGSRGCHKWVAAIQFVPAMDEGSAVHPAQLVYAQALMGFDTQRIEIDESGDLVLTDPCCDGFVFEWSRVP